VLRCAPLLTALHIAFCPLYYVFGHYNQGEEKEQRERESGREHRTYTHEYMKAVVEGSSGIVMSLDTMLFRAIGAISCNLAVSELWVF